jgi:hypothetical protein
MISSFIALIDVNHIFFEIESLGFKSTLISVLYWTNQIMNEQEMDKVIC